MTEGKEKDFKVRGTYRLVQDNRSKEYRIVDNKGHGVKLGTSKLSNAKKRSELAIRKKEKTR